MNEQAKIPGLIPKIIAVIALSVFLIQLSGCASFDEDAETHFDKECNSKRYGGVSHFRTGWVELELFEAAIASVNGVPVKIGPRNQTVSRKYGQTDKYLPHQDHFDYCNAEFQVGKKIALVVVPLIVTTEGKIKNELGSSYDDYKVHAGRAYPMTVTFEKGYTYNLYTEKVTLGGQERYVPYILRWYKQNIGIVVASPAAKFIGLDWKQVEVYAKAVSSNKYTKGELEAMWQKMQKETGYRAHQ